MEVQIIDSDWNVPSSTLIDTVQTLVDPEQNSGNGLGMAPIGHVVTVTGVTEFTIDVTLVDAEYDTGYSFSTLKTVIEEAIDTFFQNLRKDWAASEYLTVYRSQLTSTLLAIEGIVDIGGLELNEQEENVVLTAGQVPKRGDVDG